jgi:poly(3-hydroxybutyrate) depolymerase
MIVRVALIVCLASASVARADAKKDFPCAGCTTILPAKPKAILLVLHGDDAGAEETVADWRAASEDASVALVALQVPSKTGSWWRWMLSRDHDPAWVGAQLDAVSKLAPAVPLVVAGYSGGGSYLAWWVPENVDRVAAVAFVSGGYPFGAACPKKAPPILFTTGSADESIPGYIGPERDWWKKCGVEPEWRLLPGITHPGMHDALRAGEAAHVIGWLLDSAK